MKTLRVLYLCIWAATAAWAVLHETGLLPGCYITPGAALNYALNLVCITLSAGGAWLACRLLAFERVKAELARHPQQIVRWNAIRLAVTALSILPSAFTYYAAENSSSILCCALIGLTASLFCWPTAPQRTTPHNGKA